MSIRVRGSREAPFFLFFLPCPCSLMPPFFSLGTCHMLGRHPAESWDLAFNGKAGIQDSGRNWTDNNNNTNKHDDDRL